MSGWFFLFEPKGFKLFTRMLQPKEEKQKKRKGESAQRHHDDDFLFRSLITLNLSLFFNLLSEVDAVTLRKVYGVDCWVDASD